MKQKIIIAFVASVMLLAQQQINAQQWITMGNSQNRFAQPRNTGNQDSWIRSIGVGYFDGGYTNSFLHVNTTNMILPHNSSIASLGEVFRTDCPSSNSTYWRMFRGGFEIARLYNLSTDYNLRIETYSKGGNILLNPAQITRMIITDGNSPSTQQGYVGIGENFLTPQSLLHLNDDLAGIASPHSTYLQITNSGTTSSTGNTLTDGFKVGITPDGTAELRQQEIKPINIYTNNTQRMIITNDATTGEPRVGIGGSNLTTPRAYLHIGDNAWPTTGYRTWMNKGVYIHSGLNEQNHDNMYIGLRFLPEPPHGRTDAIINWGNNPIATAEQDRLRFVFTAPPALGLVASSNDGLEVARMVSNGNHGFVGIGDFWTPDIEPINQLDVRGNTVVGTSYAGLVTAPTNGMLVQGFTGIGPTFSSAYHPNRQLEVFDANAPQLRLTRTITHITRYTDFETTPYGNLRINPSDTGLLPLNGKVGVNLASGLEPKNTLEITSGPTSPSPSGLRFTNLTWSSQTVPNGGNNGVLTVDADGDVIYVQAPTGTGFGQACSAIGNPGQLTQDIEVPTNTFNFVFTNNQNQLATQNNIGIGLPNANCNPIAKLDVLQHSTDSATIGINVINNDPGNVFYLGSPHAGASIGILSEVNGINTTENSINIAGGFISSGADINISGFFETPHFYGNYYLKNFAIYVPRDRGKIQFGGSTYNNVPYLLTVFGEAAKPAGATWINFSDSLFKTNIIPYKDGLDIVRKINPVSFNYKKLLGVSENRRYVGTIAQELAQIAPYMVDTVMMVIDSIDTTKKPVLTLNSDPFFYLSINAIKELDSIVSQIQRPPLPPQLIDPANEATEASPIPEFQWHHSFSAFGYYLYVSTTPDTSGLVCIINTTDTVATILGIGKREITSVNEQQTQQIPVQREEIGRLNCGNTYYWWVKAYNQYGYSSPSETWVLQPHYYPSHHYYPYLLMALLI